MLIIVNAFYVKILNIKAGLEIVIGCPSGKKTRMNRVNYS